MLPNQLDTVKRLGELSRLLDNATNEVAEFDQIAVKAKSDYEVAYAKSFLNSEGAMDQRKQISVLACSDQKLAFEIADAHVRACKERINTLRAQISIGQSVSAALRQSFSAEGVGQYT
jgi:hypothetical protein